MGSYSDDVDYVLGTQKQDAVNQLKLSVSNALTVNPDQEAEARRAASTLKIPVDAVRDNLPEAQQQIQMDRMDFANLYGKNPHTANYLSNQQNANIAHDDVENMGLLETVLNSFKRGVPQFKNQFTTIGLSSNAKSLRDVNSVEDQLTQGKDPNSFTIEQDPLGVALMSPDQRSAFKDQLNTLIDTQATKVGSRIAEANAIPRHPIVGEVFNAGKAEGLKGVDRFAPVFSAFMKDPVSFIASIGPESMVGNAPAMIGAIPATIFGGPAAGAAVMGAGSFTTDYPSSILEALTNHGVDPQNKEQLVEAVKDQSLMKQVGREAFAHASVVSAFDAASAGIASKVPLPKSISSVLDKKPIIREITNMIIQQPIQGTLGAVGEAGGQIAAGQELDPANIVAEFAGEFFGAPAEVLSMSAGHLKDRMTKAKEADTNFELLTQLNTLATASKVRARDAESFQTFLQSALEDGPVDHIYIEPKALAQTLDQAGISLAEFTKTSPLVSAQLQESLATNTDLSIPIAEFATHLAGQTYSQQLIEHLKTDPQGMSRAEAQEFIKTQGEVLQAEVERVLGKSYQDQSFNDSRDRVYQAVLDNLNETNRFTAQKNEIDATLIATRTAVRAAQLRMTPEELFNKHLLKVAGDGFESTTGDVVLNQAKNKITEILDAKKSKDNLKRVVPMAPVRNWLLKAIQEHIGVDISNYHHQIDSYAINHTIKNHGNEKHEKNRGQVAITDKDFELLPEILDNPDSVILGTKNKRGQDQVFSVKQMPDGTALIVEEIRTGEKTLAVESMRKMAGAKYAKDLIPSVLPNVQNDTSTVPIVIENPDAGKTLFQAQRGQIAFGSDISKSPSIITLLKSADLSTFLHESGHFFFESDINLAADLSRTAAEMGASFLTDGERQLMGDVSKMLEWHGLQGTLNDQLNQWYTLSPEEKRSYHERTAESFERYLFEGKAPSIELQRIFQAFRAWLMNVYKSIEDFVARNPEAGKLDDSIRQVFDRMLASTEQIQLAEQGRSMMPLFESANQAGMTTEEFAAYHALDLDASMDAVSSLEAKGLKDMQWLHNARGKIIKKLQKQNVARRAEVMMDARREVLSQPIYRAWTFLTNRMDKDQKIVPDELPKSDKDSVTPEVDSMFTAIAKLGGLKRDEIDALMGLDPKMKSPMPAFGKYVFKRNGGESLDFIGEILANYGYLSVDEHGKFDTRELEDKLDAELRGEPQYAIGVDPRLLGQEGRAGEGLNLEEIGAGRLDFGELVGLPVPREQINQLEAMKMVAMNGIHPDLVAEQFGISSGDELVQSFLTLPNPKEAIANLTDQMMLERYGDITSPEALEKAADMAIHNEARAKFVATELNALNKATGKPKVLISAAKEFAKNMIDRLIIRNLKPSPYAASEVRAAKAAEKALKEGKLEQAAADKRNQIINTYATKAVYDAQEEVEKGLRYLAKFDNEGTRKALDVDYLDQIDAILERFDLRKGTTLKNIDKRKSLAAWITQQEELGIEVDLPNKVKAEAYRQSYKDMTVEELRGLIDSIKQIEHLGRLKEKLLTVQDKRRFSDIINQMVQSVEESSHHRQIDNRTRDTLGNRAMRLFKGLFAAHRKTASLARELDGYKENGPMWEYLIRGMNKAGDHEATMRADATHRLSVLLDPILKGGKFGGKGQKFPTIEGSLNRGEQIVIALNMGNAGNMQRLLDGRGWQIEQLVPIMKNLTTADWNFVQNIWDFFESYRPLIAEKERRVMGKEPNWIEPQRLTVTTKEGEQIDLRGGYFPIVYDPRQSGRAEQFADAEAAKQMMRGAFNAATTRRSFTKDRAEEVTGRPLILTWDALFRGVNDVIHDLTWHEWVIDANRIIKNESLDHAIRTGFGADVIAQFKSAIADIAKGDTPDMNDSLKYLAHLRSGAAVAGLGFNLMNAMIQPLGLTQSMVRVGTRWVALGVAEWAKSPIGLVKQVHEKSEFMRNRARTLNREVNEVQSIVQGKGEIREKLDALMFAPMQSLQLVADMPTWWGAYQKALADPTLIDAENGVDEATAIARADQTVLDSQGGGQIKDLARVQRGGNLLKLFTLFYGYFSAAYNLGVDRTKQTNFKNPLEVMGLAWDFLLLYSVPSVLSTLLVEAFTPSGNDGDDWEKIAKKLAANQVSYLMGLMVGIREATGTVQYLTGTKIFDIAYGGPAGLRFYQELDKLGKQIGQGELDRALARSLINVGGIALHLPSAQINRTVDGVIAISEGETQNPGAILFGFQR